MMHILIALLGLTLPSFSEATRKIASTAEIGQCTEATLKVLNPTEAAKKPRRRIQSKMDASIEELTFADGPFVNQVRIYCETNRDRLPEYTACVQRLDREFTPIPKPKDIRSYENQVTQQYYRMRHETVGSYCAFSGRRGVSLSDFADCAVLLRNGSSLDAIIIGDSCDRHGSKAYAECVLKALPAPPAPDAGEASMNAYLRAISQAFEGCIRR